MSVRFASSSATTGKVVRFPSADFRRAPVSLTRALGNIYWIFIGVCENSFRNYWFFPKLLRQYIAKNKKVMSNILEKSNTLPNILHKQIRTQKIQKFKIINVYFLKLQRHEVIYAFFRAK
jgi:hypothetical protein